MIDSTYASVQSIPIVAAAIPNNPPIRFPSRLLIPVAIPRWYDTITPIEIVITGRPTVYIPADKLGIIVAVEREFLWGDL